MRITEGVCLCCCLTWERWISRVSFEWLRGSRKEVMTNEPSAFVFLPHFFNLTFPRLYASFFVVLSGACLTFPTTRSLQSTKEIESPNSSSNESTHPKSSKSPNSTRPTEVPVGSDRPVGSGKS